MLLVILVPFNTYVLVWKPFICLHFCCWDLFKEQFGATARRDFIVVLCANYTCSWTRRLLTHTYVLITFWMNTAMGFSWSCPWSCSRCKMQWSGQLLIYFYLLITFVCHPSFHKASHVSSCQLLDWCLFHLSSCISYQCASEFNSGGCSYL